MIILPGYAAGAATRTPNAPAPSTGRGSRESTFVQRRSQRERLWGKPWYARPASSHDHKAAVYVHSRSELQRTHDMQTHAGGDIHSQHTNKQKRGHASRTYMYQSPIECDTVKHLHVPVRCGGGWDVHLTGNVGQPVRGAPVRKNYIGDRYHMRNF